VFQGPDYWDYTLIENGATQDHESNLYASGCVGTTPCLDECTGKLNYSTDVLAAKVVQFIEDAAGSPFFVYFAPYAPHGPSCPAERHLGLFDNVPDWRPPNYDEAGDDSDKPLWVQNRCPMSQTLKDNIDADRILMLGAIQGVDEAVGAIMAKLRDVGQDDNTLILYTSDNGFAWGEHCRRAKSCAYEECARVPLVVRYPPLALLPRVETRFGLNIDFALTFGELAGLFPPPSTPPDGRSLVRVVADTERVWRDDFLIEHWDNDDNPNSGIPTLACVRENELKYTELVTAESELYDLAIDPYELENRTNNAGYATAKARLAARLRELRPDWPPP
jgi:arylsulfatase A-like enzyme